MRFFFYGTLMDDDVRADLLGPARRELRVRPGVLLHHRRRAARDGYYPVLVPEARGRVDGLFVEGLTRELVLWIAHFEGPTYEPDSVTAVDPAGRRLGAWSFLPTRRAYATDRPWDLRVWQRHHKPAARRMLALWRRRLPTGHPMSMDAPWRVRRRIDAIAERAESIQAAPLADAAGQRLVPPVRATSTPRHGAERATDDGDARAA
jgi:hypothetical protein